MVDDQRLELTAQDIRALFANRQYLDCLALGEKRTRMFACKPCNL